jgi:predicted lipoprotein with Yx(FWY)xxD motif
MTPNRSITLLASAAATTLTGLTVAGCGGGGGATASHTTTTAASGRTTTVDVAKTGLGKVLVDSKGRTLYLFKKDKGPRSVCSGECAVDWPPLRATGKPTVAGGAKASLVATTSRADGKPQVTYNAHPLYLFEGDQKPGDTNGQGSTAFGAGWYALSQAGDQISANAPSNSTAPSSSSGGY